MKLRSNPTKIIFLAIIISLLLSYKEMGIVNAHKLEEKKHKHTSHKKEKEEKKSSSHHHSKDKKKEKTDKSTKQ